jgi:quercetin dioxygenase-like cupin family protein
VPLFAFSKSLDFEIPLSHTTQQQENVQQDVIKDYLKYDEVPGVTNCSKVSMPPGMVIDRHVHPSKYEIFLVSAGSGVFRVWSVGASAEDEPREVFELRQGVCCTVGPEEPHDICAEADGLVMTYLGVVAPDSKPVPQP